MPRTLDAVIGQLPLDQQQEIEVQAAILIHDEMIRCDLHKAQVPAQERLTATLHVAQEEVSCKGMGCDLLISAPGS
ncbi:MAG: hypothetical protein H7833_17480 [Magnetococcus sp. DMHC-1]